MPDSPSDDALTVAQFIVGWWPGLEDGLEWGPGMNADPVLLAAQRICAAANKESIVPDSPICDGCGYPMTSHPRMGCAWPDGFSDTHEADRMASQADRAYDEARDAELLGEEPHA